MNGSLQVGCCLAANSSSEALNMPGHLIRGLGPLCEDKYVIGVPLRPLGLALQ